MQWTSWSAECPFPIWWIFMTIERRHPQSYRWRQTYWKAFGKGRVIMGVDDESTWRPAIEDPEIEGGEYNHLLLGTETPNHTHSISPVQQQVDAVYHGATTTMGLTYTTTGVNNRTWGNLAHNVVQPYITAYMRVRVNRSDISGYADLNPFNVDLTDPANKDYFGFDIFFDPTTWLPDPWSKNNPRRPEF